MSSNRRGNLLNPHGKFSRVMDYYALPATLQRPSHSERGGFVEVLDKGKQILASLTSNLFKYFFPLAEVNNLMKHRTLFEVLELNPISTPPQITIENRRIEEIVENQGTGRNELENLKKGLVVKRPPSHDIYSDFYYSNKKKKSMFNSESQTDLPYSAIADNFKGNFSRTPESIAEKYKALTGKGKEIKKKHIDSCGEMETKGTDEEDELDFQVKQRRTEKRYERKGEESESGRKVIRKIIRKSKLSIAHCTDLSVVYEKPSNLDSDEIIEDLSFEEYKKYMLSREKPSNAITVDCYSCESSITPENVSILHLPQADPKISPPQSFNSFTNPSQLTPPPNPPILFHNPNPSSASPVQPFPIPVNPFTNPAEPSLPIPPPTPSALFAETPTEVVHTPVPSALASNPPCNISTNPPPNTCSTNPFLNTSIVQKLETPYTFGEQRPSQSLGPSQIAAVAPKTNEPPSDTPIDMEMEFTPTDFKDSAQTYPSSSAFSGHTDMFKNSTENSSNGIKTPNTMNSHLFATSNVASLFAPPETPLFGESGGIKSNVAANGLMNCGGGEGAKFSMSGAGFNSAPTAAFSANNSCFGSTAMFSGSSTPNTTASTPVNPNKNFSLGVVASSGKRQKR